MKDLRNTGEYHKADPGWRRRMQVLLAVVVAAGIALLAFLQLWLARIARAGSVDGQRALHQGLGAVCLVLGLVAVAAVSGTLAAGVAYFVMLSAITQDSDSTAAPIISAQLAVEPPKSRVFVDGKPTIVTDGSVTLTGNPGARFTVLVELDGKQKSTDVQLGGNGKPEPGRVGLK